MKGYWKNPAETDQIIKDGWLCTGDRACMDEDNYIFLQPATKNLIIHCGFNVFPVEVEEVVGNHPAVEQVKVIGIKDKRRGEVVAAEVVPRNGCHLKEKELRDHCRKYLAGYKVPGHFEFVTGQSVKNEAEPPITVEKSDCPLL